MRMLDLFGQMSTHDDGHRADLDFYETPRWAVSSLLYHHPAIADSRVLEPCSGRGAIADALKQAGCDLLTNDLDDAQPSMLHYDATNETFWEVMKSIGVQYDWVVTNPPFDCAFDLLKHALKHTRRGVAVLLRKTFLEPTLERGPWLAEHPPTRILGLPRIKFRGKGTDSVSCDWMIWEHVRNLALSPVVIDAAAMTRRSD